MKKYAFAAFIVASVLAQAAAPPIDPNQRFGIGPYYLGMPVAEARKLGIAGCQAQGKRTKCSATNLRFSNQLYFDVYFNNSSQRIVAVRARVQGNSNVGESKLELPKCLTGLATWSECFALPDKVMTSRNSSSSSYKATDNWRDVEVEAEINRSKVEEFLRADSEGKNTQRQGQKTQFGKRCSGS